MTRLIGLSGSLRRGSLNTALLRAAAGLMADGDELTVDTIHGIPLYDGDVEATDGIPAAVSALKEAIAGADGLLLVTPEYNNSIPGPFKNAIDWLSRPPADTRRVFAGKPVAVMGVSPGGFGTVLAQAAWLPVLRTLGVDLWTGNRMAVSHAGKLFGEDGTLADPKTVEQLRSFVQGFAAFARSASGG
ncbi:NAD(P)H-dependent FMN reductase [Azospirillum agricola]|uniref:NADPH-dependent FMN reductase n=1 Tax=Azospirillum agricola TaxID=1720247 RepID=UPI001AE964AB|nr:NADPH-dependent FMN reductase [Azospirillum agricola]MBP2227826.1 NAD(P)H-dependent FMN reductase [Azospirillum agricola]